MSEKREEEEEEEMKRRNSSNYRKGKKNHSLLEPENKKCKIRTAIISVSSYFAFWKNRVMETYEFK